jgi:hypothetical protein
MDSQKEKEPTAGTRGFVQELINRAKQENIWNVALGINEIAMMVGVTPYQKDNLATWNFLGQGTKHLRAGSNYYADFVAEVKACSSTMVRLDLIGWRAYGTQNYHSIVKLTRRPLPTIELETSGDAISERISRGKLAELTARITAHEGRMIFKVGARGLKAIELEGEEGGLIHDN